MNRPWDPQNKYKGTVLKEYHSWVLEVSCKQHTLGCLILFLKRSVSPISLSQLDNDELLELKSIMAEIESSLAKSDQFKPDSINYLQLGNNLKWLHIHCVPRYAQTKVFKNQEWADTTYGHSVVWSKEPAKSDTIDALVTSIKPLFH